MTIPPLPPSPARSETPAAAAKAPSWWRRNAVALIGVAVLVPMTAAAIGWQEWYQYFGFGARAVTAIAVAEDDTVDFVGATWGPIRGGEIDDLTGLDVPDGTRLLAAAIPVQASTEGIGCETPKLVEQSTGRIWTPTRLEIGLLSDPDEPETCLSAEAGDYELIVPFVVPDDAEGPFWVDVRPYDAGGSFLRFSFEP
ncbi:MULTISPECIES: hypothetical protein [unclassified Microbacterium]|uniref:hypothetical protein n=2 Tax=Microbacterium TaxID=33882 RepID=UPI002BD7293E|nr:hypothetical protein [Microbacterium sp.]HWK78535.1 hypothetical protein [Microbacterium sp.]